MLSAVAVALTALVTAAPPAAVRSVLCSEAVLVTTAAAAALVCTSMYRVPELALGRIIGVNVTTELAAIVVSTTSGPAGDPAAAAFTDNAGVLGRMSGPLATYRLPAAVVEAGSVSLRVMVCG